MRQIFGVEFTGNKSSFGPLRVADKNLLAVQRHGFGKMGNSRKHFLVPHTPAIHPVAHFHGVIFPVVLINSPSGNGATGRLNDLCNFKFGRFHLGLFARSKLQIHSPCKGRVEIVFCLLLSPIAPVYVDAPSLVARSATKVCAPDNSACRSRYCMDVVINVAWLQVNGLTEICAPV